ncbi:hypothetical protein B0A48_11022 [Cryoendolithus antarcticus]|uniref:ER membrane protein complex subunit 1 n=1 Tax=Cryoendolithus antarcticus TaxID=1507870 RepID=A0A1V8SZF9_9PEZI|nr:hypothetical protein B0A48_11022 [Cryoendolithus antarcticus]
MLLPIYAAVILLLRPALAVFADEAWTVDYHHALLGLPKQSTTFFHRPDPSSRASLIYTLSEQGVVGAVNPRDGGVVWRHLLNSSRDATQSSFLRAGDAQDAIVSGLGGQVTAFSAADGRVDWQHDVPDALVDLEILELEDGRGTPGAKDTLCMSAGQHPTVQRLDGATGVVKWEHKIESGDTPYQVSASTTEVFAILLHKTVLGYIKIKVITLDPVTGRKTDEYTLSSENELATAETILAVGANSASPIIAWTDSAYKTLRINVIGKKAIVDFPINTLGGRPPQRVTLHAPYLTTSLAHFLVHYQSLDSDWAEVYHIDVKTGRVEKAYDLPKIEGRSSFSTSTNGANVYFTRVTKDQVFTVASTSHGILGRWNVDSPTSSLTDGTARPVHAVSEVSVKGESVSAVRSAVLLSSGEWLLLRNGSPQWTRPEILAGTVSAAFALPSEVSDLVNELQEEAHSNPVSAYVHRVTRHIGDIQKLPSLLTALPQRFVHGFLGTGSDGSDTFGFNNIIVSATSDGHLVAVDAGRPSDILWSSAAVILSSGQVWKVRVESAAPGIVRVIDDISPMPTFFNASTGAAIGDDEVASDSAVPNTAVEVDFTLKDGQLYGTTASQSGHNDLWQFGLQKGETILSLTPRPVNDPVASIGKVLGDRKVLYKYLNPNLALLATTYAGQSRVSIYVLNTVSGAILYSNSHRNIDLAAPIAATLSENWFAYSYTAESTSTAPKGHQLVVGELFESLTSNDRGLLDAATNVSSLASSTQPLTLTQTYHIPESISKMSVTQTRQGITSRQLLAVLAESNAIVGIPRGVIDPRRPVNREPTKDEQAEGLFRYTPVIDFDPKWYLNHRREVLGVKDVITSPAILESTSLVYAYGLDVFGTRLNPSFNFDMLGKDFNKFQMLATVAALAVATFVVAPLVQRKQINQRWQFT